MAAVRRQLEPKNCSRLLGARCGGGEAVRERPLIPPLLRIYLIASYRKLYRVVTSLGRSRKWTDFHGLYQTIRQGETMDHVPVGKDCPSQVAHDLMNVDQD